MIGKIISFFELSFLNQTMPKLVSSAVMRPVHVTPDSFTDHLPKRKCPAVDERSNCCAAAGQLNMEPRRTRRNKSDEDS